MDEETLKSYEKVWNDYKTDDSYNNFGRLNLVAALGERAGFMLEEIRCLQGKNAALLAELNRLRSGLAAIEARWRAASQDSVFRRAYRDTMAECAAELAVLLAGTDDAELQAEIEKAMADDL